jgi:hypothetical protein
MRSTRYDKLAASYLAFFKLASIRIWRRANEFMPYPRRRLGSGSLVLILAFAPRPIHRRSNAPEKNSAQPTTTSTDKSLLRTEIALIQGLVAAVAA